MAVEGQVARILSDESLVINRGTANGVTDGMVFVVYAQLDDVTDPASGESLGALEVVKARVIVSHTQERMSTCVGLKAGEKGDEDPRQHTLSAEMVAVSMMQSRQAGGKLDVDRTAVSGMPKAGPVAVGDHVRSTVTT